MVQNPLVYDQLTFSLFKLFVTLPFFLHFTKFSSACSAFYLRVCILINIQTEDKFCGYGESGTGIFGYQPLKNSSY